MGGTISHTIALYVMDEVVTACLGLLGFHVPFLMK